MDSISMYLTFDNPGPGFRAGEKLTGTAEWKFPVPPGSLELRVLWFTRGKGTQDTMVVARKKFPKPENSGKSPFCFILPASPFSFSGKLISLVWAIEMLQVKTAQFFRREFVLSSSGKEIVLVSEK